MDSKCCAEGGGRQKNQPYCVVPLSWRGVWPWLFVWPVSTEGGGAVVLIFRAHFFFTNLLICFVRRREGKRELLAVVAGS